MRFVSRKMLASFLFTLVLFVVALTVLHPIFNSGDDVYLLYIMGGGFGAAPGNLLQYNHLMHPWLGGVISWLFTRVPAINWFTVLLYLVQYVSCACICHLLFSRYQFFKAMCFYLVFFVVFGLWFMLQPTFTVTSAVAGIAALGWILHHLECNKEWRSYIAPSLLLLVAASLRIHVLLPVLLLSTPFVLAARGLGAKLKFATFIVCVGLLVWILNVFQTSYYRTHIAGWESQEAYRQAVFGYFNKPIRYGAEAISSYDTKRALLEYGIFIDRQFLSPQAIKEIGAVANYQRTRFDPYTRNALYWLFIESRVFVVSLLGVCAFLFLWGEARQRLAILLGVMGTFVLALFLFCFMKLPMYMVPVFCGPSMVFAMMLVKPDDMFESRGASWSLVVLMAGCIAWGLVRAKKIDEKGRKSNLEFYAAVREVSKFPDALFVVTEDLFPMDYMYVWDTPAQYPVRNVVYKDHLFNGTEGLVLRHFGLHDVAEIWGAGSVLFWGRQTGLLQRYYREAHGGELRFSEPLDGFKRAEVRKLVRQDD